MPLLLSHTITGSDSMTVGQTTKEELHKLLPFLQIKKTIKNKYKHSNTKKNAVFGDDSLPDYLVHIVRDLKWTNAGIGMTNAGSANFSNLSGKVKLF